MSKIEFEEDKNMLYSRFEASSKVPKIIEFVVKTGIAKDANQANMVLLGIVVLIVLVSLFLFWSGGKSEPSLSPDEMQFLQSTQII